MTKEELRQRLYQTKDRLESEGHYIKPEVDYEENKADMILYQRAFEQTIADAYGLKDWFDATGRWSIYGNSIHKRRNADEIINDIIDHIIYE